MTDEKKQPGWTEFGGLEEKQSTFEEAVKRRFDGIDQAQREQEVRSRLQGKDIEAMKVDMRENTQATRRTEAKVDAIADKTKDFVDVADYAKKTFTLVEWVVKRLLPLVVAVGALVTWFVKQQG